MNYSCVRLILGDQLNHQHAWFAQKEEGVLYLIAELHQEAHYTRHHSQKIAAFFAAMANFARELQEAGHHVVHLTLDDTKPYKDLPSLIAHWVERVNAETFEYQRPDEYRLMRQLELLSLPQCRVHCVESDHFLLPFDEIGDYFKSGKAVKMENFYRKMRQRFDILMDADKPFGGQWNFDGDNRNKLKKSDIEALPRPLLFANDVTSINERIKRHQIPTIGQQQERLVWPISRHQGLNLLAHFCRVCLPLFGRFQDAMTDQHPSQWSLYHSRLSFAINTKMLSPREVVDAALESYHQSQRSDNPITLAQIEGFVRQIIGWREYMRGIYWINMPTYATLNELQAQRPLPSYFWHGRTQMKCMRACIGQSLEWSYAHHIQRLMVTGNLCLLAGVAPDEVDAWYLGIYIDAIEWVEMPNTRGMALFADGGIIATKPYCASGNYINKMSDYCKGCHYDVKQRSGERACPFNSLYWRFMLLHRERLSRNPRIGMIYRSWDKLSEAEQAEVLATAERYLAQIDAL